MKSSKEFLQKRDSEFLKILRSISILGIVLSHLGGWLFPPWTELLLVFVPVFFFISGAVSYNMFLKSKSVTEYLLKRMIGLLVPYYCICILALCVFVIQHIELPVFVLGNLMKWITIVPENAIMPFPLGQVWFLHTLIIISLLSPLIFWLYKRSFIVFTIFLCFSLAVSAIQLRYNIGLFFVIYGHNLFKPLVLVSFFCFGFMVIDRPILRDNTASLAIIISCLIFSVALVRVLTLNPDYVKHTYYPDLYFVTGSIGAIWLFLFLQPYILKFYKLLPPIFYDVSDYIFRHTFAIFLLHTFAILLVEDKIGLVHPQQKSISYAITKLTLVMLITLSLSPIFTKVTSFVSRQILMLIELSKNRITGSREIV